VRQLDALESGRAVPNTTAALQALSPLSFPLADITTLNRASSAFGDVRSWDTGQTITNLRAEETALNQEIEDKKCTVEARAKAGSIKAVDDGRFDGNTREKARQIAGARSRSSP
jgi:hypothetical protein